MRTPQAIGVGVLVLVVVAAAAIYAVPSWRAAFLDWWDSVLAPKEPEVVALYEGETYNWYDVSGRTGVPASAPAGRVAGGVRYPNEATITVSETQGMIWQSAGEASTITLLDRKGLTREAWAISPGGTSAVLFNDTTRSFDVFTIAYEGAYLSYAGSFPVPEAPAYWSAIGYASDDIVVVRTGNPNSFELYRVGATGAMPLRSLSPESTP